MDIVGATGLEMQIIIILSIVSVSKNSSTLVA